MLKIWGRLSSINVRKAVWAANETGVQYERTDAGAAFGVVDADWYGKMNPNRLVPTIDDDGFVLWESNVVVRYLCAKYAPGQLYPLDLVARFDAERWMDWQQTTVGRAGRDAFLQLIRTPADQRDQAAIDASQRQMEPLLKQIDAHLATRDYIAGTRFTMADIPLACEAHRWFALPLSRPATPHLDRWYARVSQRPAAVSVLTLPLS